MDLLNQLWGICVLAATNGFTLNQHHQGSPTSAPEPLHQMDAVEMESAINAKLIELCLVAHLVAKTSPPNPEDVYIDRIHGAGRFTYIYLKNQLFK